MNYEVIKPYIEKKLVSEQSHPENQDVRIFNYTQKCQFEQAWDDITRQCRGLILNVKTGEVLARPFPKFFNYAEYVSKEWPIPESVPEIYEKLDGSLGILYELNGKEWIATRGSFMSDQAIWATNWWRSHVLTPLTSIKGVTHLFEIIYPKNRIVVSYDFSGLVHLTTLDNETGQVIPEKWYDPVRSVRKINPQNLGELLKLDEPNSEGFVLFYPEENVRMKIKFPEYVRLHRIITGVNEIAIWEMLRDGQGLEDLIEKVPDEFFKWVKEVSTRLLDEFDSIANESERIFESVRYLPIRKEQALKIQESKEKYRGVVFALLDGKPSALIIWRQIRPHGAHVFKTDIDL